MMDQTENGGLEFIGAARDFMVENQYVTDIKCYDRKDTNVENFVEQSLAHTPVAVSIPAGLRTWRNYNGRVSIFLTNM